MKFEQLYKNQYDVLLDNTLQDKSSLIEQLEKQHALVINKLLPEIDLHFWSLMKNNDIVDNQIIEKIYADFINYQSHLRDHFFMEEKLVFPAILSSKELEKVILDFMNKHDDFETLIGKMLKDIRNQLTPLFTYMSLRILELKLQNLALIMEEHQVLEDHLFQEHLA